MKRELYTEIICGLLIALFAYAAFSKSFEYNKFVMTLKILPLIDKGAATVAWLLLAAEVIVVLLLLISKTRMAGLYGSLSLLLLFTFYLTYMILFEKNLPCSCGGVISKMSWRQHIVFNLFFIAISFAAIITHKRIMNHKRIT